LKPLQARKQLLLVESEVNRAQLASDWAALTRHVGVWRHEFHVLSSTTTSLFRGIRTVREIVSRGKSSVTSTLFNVARTGLSTWSKLILRSR